MKNECNGVVNSSSTSPAESPNKFKSYLIGAGIVLLLGAILYFVGLQSGKSQLASQKAAFDMERNGLQSKVTSAESERVVALNRAAMMEARAALYRTAIDLDARNFGTANTHLKEAASALGNVQHPGVAPLRDQISATDLNVAVNLGEQRVSVLNFAEQLNKLMPATDPPSEAPSNTPDTATPPISQP